VTYESCTPWTFGGVNQGKGWCSTKTDALDNHVNGGGHYGFCSDSCSPSVSTRFVYESHFANYVLKKKKLFSDQEFPSTFQRLTRGADSGKVMQKTLLSLTDPLRGGSQHSTMVSAEKKKAQKLLGAC